MVKRPNRKTHNMAVRGERPLGHTGNPTCWHINCTRSSVAFRRWQWWCSIHDPGEPLVTNCGHSMLSGPMEPLGKIMCGWCGSSWEAP